MKGDPRGAVKGGPKRSGRRGGYLVATEAMAGIHGEGLISLVVLPHMQAFVEFQVLDLQYGEWRSKQDRSIKKLFIF